MLVAVLDTETSGLNVEQDQIIEIAIVLYSTLHKRQVLTYSSLINQKGLYVPKDASDINGVTADMCDAYGVEAVASCNVISQLLSQADVIVAHNGNAFDRPLVNKLLKSAGMSLPDTHWIDSKMEVTYPAHIKTRKLLHLCAELGVQNRAGHEALNDSLMLLELLIKLNCWEDIKGIVRSRQNKVRIS